MKNTQSLFFAFLLVLTASCQSSESPYPASGIFVSDWPDIRQLYRNLREHGNMLVVYPTGNEAVTEAYRSWAEALARDNSGLQLKVMADRQVSREDLQREALLLVGSPESNSLLREILPGLPLRMEADKQITIGRQTYRSATAVVTLPIYPNPLHPRLPIAVYTGFDDRQVLQALPAGSGRRGYPIRWGQFGYEIREEGRRVLMGQFDWESWEIDPELVFDFSREAQQIGFRPPYRYLVQGEHFASEQAEALMSQADECARQIAHFTDKPLPAQPVSHFIYPSAEIKGLMTGNTRQSHLDISRREVHSVLNETYRGNWSGAENELLLRLMIGRPKTQVLEQGLALYFTPGWQVKGYRYWASRLYNSGNLLSLEEVLEEGNQVDASRLLIPCLAASFVEFLLDHWGRERFLELYPGWDPGEQEIRGLEKRWHA
ncbi:MAG: hypothetical protein R3350_01275, partial [Saprospiraceae bacterium]|nr:hypothetical protein [Saprospiraceae bacterium]